MLKEYIVSRIRMEYISGYNYVRKFPTEILEILTGNLRNICIYDILWDIFGIFLGYYKTDIFISFEYSDIFLTFPGYSKVPCNPCSKRRFYPIYVPRYPDNDILKIYLEDLQNIKCHFHTIYQ